LLRCLTNGEHNALQILHHIVIGEAEHAISAGRKPCITSFIMANTLFEIVAFAIDLNDEFAGMRDEIRDVVAHRGLSTKPETGKPICLQVAPQQGFGARHFSSQAFGTGSLYLIHRSVRHTPLPNPPPQGGREPDSGDRLTANHSFPITSPRKP
jgi:hypothetical protein